MWWYKFNNGGKNPLSLSIQLSGAVTSIQWYSLEKVIIIGMNLHYQW